MDMLDKNPLRGFQLLNVDNQIEHYLKEDELQRLLEVLRTDDNRTVCLLLMFLLCTGSRSNEARQAKWSQIDTENAVWRIPASNSKSKKVRSVPLNDSSLWVLEQVGTRDKFDVVLRIRLRATATRRSPMSGIASVRRPGCRICVSMTCDIPSPASWCRAGGVFMKCSRSRATAIRR